MDLQCLEFRQFQIRANDAIAALHEVFDEMVADEAAGTCHKRDAPPRHILSPSSPNPDITFVNRGDLPEIKE